MMSEQLWRELRLALREADFTAAAIAEAVGAAALAALHRGEPVPARRALGERDDALAVMIRLWLLGDGVSAELVRAALAPVELADAVNAGLLASRNADLVAALDVRPLAEAEPDAVWVVSDSAASGAGRGSADRVMGAGRATLSLVRAIPGADVDEALDVGTGSGVLAVVAGAARVVATDVNPRAVELATATAILNDAPVEVRLGSWFEPVLGERFDRIVANPPFVVGSPAEGAFVYRDSGLELDAASALVIGGVADHLAPGGLAIMLGSWVQTAGESWQQRVARWIPDHGVDAWVVQRDLANPELYVGTWIRDEGLDTHSPEGEAKAESWLQTLADADVQGIGFGYVFLRAKGADEPSDVVAEELLQPFDGSLGDEAVQHFQRMDVLRDMDLGEQRFALSDQVALERVAVATPPSEAEPWTTAAIRIHRTDGPRWAHGLDEPAAQLISGMRGAFTLDELIDLLELGHGLSGIRDGAHAMARDLYRHGILRLE